jgi:SAM-dependent methyltransferase
LSDTDLYSLVHTGNEGDVEFYVRACDSADWVLELGCGSGRIGRAISQVTKNYIGIDIDCERAYIAAENGIVCCCADMVNFQLNCRFDRIIVPSNTIYCLLSEDTLVSCFKNIRNHLAKNGQLVFDSFVAYDQQMMTYTSKSRKDNGWVKEIYYDYKIWDVYESVEILPGLGRVDVHYSHKCRSTDEKIETKIPQRYFSHSELPQLLGKAGLIMTSIVGGFKNEPLSDSCERIVVSASLNR